MNTKTVSTNGVAGLPLTQAKPIETARVRAVVATVVGNALEWFDFATYAFFATTIARHFFPLGNDFAALMNTFAAFGIGFVARPLGAIVFGRLGDDRGRKFALLLSMPLMGLGTLLVGGTPSYAAIGVTAPVVLVFARLMQGFAAGGEVGNAMSFLAEWAPPGRRAFFTSFQQCSALLGTLCGSGCAALLNSFLPSADLIDWGWRAPFLIGGLLIAPLGLFLRAKVGETPVFEKAHVPGAHKVSASVWASGARAIAICAAWVTSFYIYLIYLPSFLPKFAGLSPSTALWANTGGLFVMTIAIPLAGLASDFVGRKPILLVAAILALIVPYPVFHVLTSGPSEIEVYAVLMGAGLLAGAFAGIAPVAMAEMFPTESRTTGVSVSFGLATGILGGFAPLVSTWLIKISDGWALAPCLYLIACAAVSVFTIATLKETAFRGLD